MVGKFIFPQFLHVNCQPKIIGGRGEDIKCNCMQLYFPFLKNCLPMFILFTQCKYKNEIILFVILSFSVRTAFFAQGGRGQWAVFYTSLKSLIINRRVIFVYQQWGCS